MVLEGCVSPMTHPSSLASAGDPIPAATAMAEARATLQRVFGFAQFRAGQAEVVAAVLDGREVLAIMPTGSGKSLCYQLPALMRPGLTVVVSPLIALMRDQVRGLQTLGIAAAALNSANDPRENAEIERRLSDRAIDILYVAPERLVRPGTLSRLREADVRLLAIDEAHCVSQWGHDFRPEYLALGETRRALGDVQTLALTATADQPTRDDIRCRLFDREPTVFLRSFDRPNLRLAMRPKASVSRQLGEFLDRHRGASGIVYAASRKRTEQLAATLRAAGHDAIAYHAGLDPAVRAAAQDRFLAEDGVVVVATVAFGMGIDKPDVRFVAHADLPASIEAYYQEIGRAGRDGLPAETLTLYGLDDMRLRRLQIDESDTPEARKRIEHSRLTALLALAEAPACRRRALLAYFGEPSEACGNCDLCQDGCETFDGTVAAQKAMSAMLRTGERFATEHLVAILRGDATERILSWGHERLPTFGVGREFTTAEWRALFRQMYAVGLIDLEVSGYGRWRVTAAGRAVLSGRETVRLRRDPPPRKARPGAPSDGRGVAGGTVGLPMDGECAAMLADLKAKRLALARAQGVPAYMVFPDRTLLEMATARPQTLEDLARLHGVGEAKRARYGRAFLEVIARSPRPASD
jgi:ATP-dependent DNA helicase RecQ